MSRLAILCVALLATSGCGDKKAATSILSGKITYKGQAVNGGTLVLYRTTDAGDSITIPISQEGTFRSGDVAEGEYKAVIEPSLGHEEHMPKNAGPKAAESLAKMKESATPPTIRIPDKYKQRLSSDWLITVGKGEQVVNKELTD